MFGLRPILTKRKFLKLKWKTVKKIDNIHEEWSDQEENEFQKYTSEFNKIYQHL